MQKLGKGVEPPAPTGVHLVLQVSSGGQDTPKYLKLPTYSTWPPLMVTMADSRESPLPTNMTLIFAALILMANCYAVVSMHYNINTRFSGLVENKTISFV
jgi:hypothetical protein